MKSLKGKESLKVASGLYKKISISFASSISLYGIAQGGVGGAAHGVEPQVGCRSRNPTKKQVSGHNI
jgi:hypothetical protein